MAQKCKLYFPKRIPEPSRMTRGEEEVFNKFMEKNYERIFCVFVDNVLRKTLLKEGIIADFGCGSGLLVKAFAERSKRFNVIGIDFSLSMIKDARLRCAKLKNVEFFKSRVEHTQLLDASVDLIVCKDSFHEFGKPLDVLQEMVRVTRPNAWICIQDLRRDLPMDILRSALPRKTLFQKLQYQSARAAYTKEEMAHMLKKLNIKPHQLSTLNVTKPLKKRYSSIAPDQLRIGFQARYFLMLKR